ncbi:MAG: hypothetical protein PUE67_06785 [Oscillospiraceae bacterium]|nr:hypothetical protein [Oscillospiraceae bacterium]
MKTRLYTRKRALISSVAMLLVAMIALGTATFAWFTSRPDANATGLVVRATAANGLVILTQSHEAYLTKDGGSVASSDWTHDDFLNYGPTAGENNKPGSIKDPIKLDATSFNLGATDDVFSKGFRVDAENDDNYAAKSDATVNGNITSGFFQETIKCKVTGAIDATKTYKVKVTSLTATKKTRAGDDATEFTDLQNSLRIALEYKKAGAANYAMVGVYTLKSDGSSNKYVAQAGTYGSAGTLSAENHDFDANTTLANQVIDTVGTTGTDVFRLTVYLDGEDAGCKTSNYVAADLISDVTLNLIVDVQ